MSNIEKQRVERIVVEWARAVSCKAFARAVRNVQTRHNAGTSSDPGCSCDQK
jgi:hypothetical protein